MGIIHATIRRFPLHKYQQIYEKVGQYYSDYMIFYYEGYNESLCWDRNNISWCNEHVFYTDEPSYVEYYWCHCEKSGGLFSGNQEKNYGWLQGVYINRSQESNPARGLLSEQTIDLTDKLILCKVLTAMLKEFGWASELADFTSYDVKKLKKLCTECGFELKEN